MALHLAVTTRTVVLLSNPFPSLLRNGCCTRLEENKLPASVEKGKMSFDYTQGHCLGQVPSSLESPYLGIYKGATHCNHVADRHIQLTWPSESNLA